MERRRNRGLIAAGAFLMLVIVLAVPILRLRHTVDAATRAINDLNDRTGPLLGNVNDDGGERQHRARPGADSLDGVNLQLARVDTITEHAQHVTANVANLATVVSAAAANPLVKVAAFGYGVRKAAAGRRHADEEREVRDDAQAAAQGRAARQQLTTRATRRERAMKRLLWLGVGLAVGAIVVRKVDAEGAARSRPPGIAALAVGIRWRPRRVGA